MLPTEQSVSPTQRFQVTASGLPSWWVGKGRSMRLKSKTAERVVIGNAAAELTISINPGKPNQFLVAYRLQYSLLSWNAGQTCLERQDLLALIGLVNDYCPVEFEREKMTALGAEAFLEGSFVRSGPYLNLPGPETNKYHTNNVSVYLWPETQLAIIEYLSLGT